MVRCVLFVAILIVTLAHGTAGVRPAHAEAPPSPAATPSAVPSPVPSPARTERPRPASPSIRVFRVTMDNPYRGGSGWRTGTGWGDGPAGFEEVRGTVWYDNQTTETLSDVVVTVHFYNTRFYREAGTAVYRVGTLGPMASRSVNYRWENVAGERVVPWVEVTWREPGQATPQRSESRPYAY